MKYPDKTAYMSRWRPLLAGMFILTGCQDSPVGLDDGISVDGVEYRVTEIAIAESFPVQIGVTVELSNSTDTPKTAVFPDGCVVLLRAYRDDAEPVWDMATGRGCTGAIVEVTLAPGESREFNSGLVSAAEILGETLPNSVYRITAYLRPGQTVELAAGEVDLAVP